MGLRPYLLFGGEMGELPEPLKILRVIGEYKEIKGRITVHKLIHNLQKKRSVDSGYRFITYSFGPYSKELEEDLKMLESLGLIAEVKEGEGTAIKITKRGLEIIKNLKNAKSTYSKIPI